MNYKDIDQYVANQSQPHHHLPHHQESIEPKPKRSIKRIIKRTLLFVIVLILLLGSWMGWRFYDDAAKITGDKNPFQILGLLWPASLNETNGRVNILLAGYSVDDPNHGGAALTDSIMIVSVNPSTKATTLISVPRDTWVNIPGFGYQKINAAYEDGQQSSFSEPGYPSGGMGLLEKVVQQDFGVQFSYYALIDYTAFKDAVNEVGGITINIQSTDPRGLYDPYTNLKLPNGEVTLNGQQALDLARARGDGPGSYGFPGSDFDRTKHQQEMLIALEAKASQGSFISNPFKVIGLADAVGSNVKTDMSLGVMETLYRDTKGINTNSMQSITLDNYNGQDLLTSYRASDGEDALVPTAGFNNFSAIQSAIASSLN